jgi:hypothetical protein
MKDGPVVVSTLGRSLRTARVADGLQHNGPRLGRFLCAEIEMSGKIEAGDRPDLQHAGGNGLDALAVLEAAFDERLNQIGGRAVILDSMVEIAARHGYQGSVDEAASILRATGRYIVMPGQLGRFVAFRPTG